MKKLYIALLSIFGVILLSSILFIFIVNTKWGQDKAKNYISSIAKKNNIVIGINIDEIINSKLKQKAEILARIKQNIKLCNKNKIKMKFISLSKTKK